MQADQPARHARGPAFSILILSIFTSLTLFGCATKLPETSQSPGEEKALDTVKPDEQKPVTALQSYVNSIRQKIERNWVRPNDYENISDCIVDIVQAPGGIVMDMTFPDCDQHTDEFRQGIRRAIAGAEPLPAPSDPSLFESDIRFYFKLRP